MCESCATPESPIASGKRTRVPAYVTVCSGLLPLFLFVSIFLGIGIRGLLQYRPYKHGVTTTGTITALAPAADNDDGGAMYSPVVTFNTTEGEQVVFKDNFSININPRRFVGDEVRVSYLPSDPQNTARNLDSGGKGVMLAFVCVSGGVMLLLTGWWIYSLVAVARHGQAHGHDQLATSNGTKTSNRAPRGSAEEEEEASEAVVDTAGLDELFTGSDSAHSAAASPKVPGVRYTRSCSRLFTPP